MAQRLLCGVALLALGACTSTRGTDPFGGGPGEAEGGEPTTTAGSNDPSAGTSGSPASTGDAAGSETPEADASTGFKFDLAGGEGGPTGGPCGKVDFVFAIDNSGSMGGFQQSLAASFPGFIDAIQSNINAQDYRILVTDSDAFATMGANVSGCGADGTCEPLCASCSPTDLCVCTCEAEATECVDPDASCDDTHGAGKRRNEQGMDCGIEGDQRYMTGSQPNLAETFSCLALVGDAGMAMERPVTAATKAITVQNEAGACNEGFLRDDALLVVTFITDDPPGANAPSQFEDAGYLAHPDRWFDALVAAKGGNPNNVVVLGIVSASFGAEVFVDFVSMFGDRGLLGEITAPSYDGFFEEAVALVDVACDEFEPEG
ncbi:MAG: hypothetical protein ACE37F_23870 [Nannocystaceae bacterium]|nr:hypothetical protein [bacterium]